jgi:methylaspartate ammonia-lyase
MKVKKAVASPGLTGFYSDDQEAIRRGAEEDGLVYLGEPVTPGFTSIRQRGESVSIMLVLDDGQVAFGDCASVQYAGVCDRDPPFFSSDAIKIISHEIAGLLVGRELTAFRPLAEEFDKLRFEGQGESLALRYGLTQALLDGVAKARKKTMTEVIVEEYDLPLVLEAVPIYAQTGDDRYTNVDKMILKRVDVLPHGLINNVEKKLGVEGELLIEYLEWIKGRIGLIGDADYRPALHFDVYGTIGLAFGMDIGRMADYIERLEQAAAPLELHIEHPVDAGSKQGQIETMKELCQVLRQRGVKVQIVADEWANTLEDIREFVDNGAADMVQIKAPDLGGVNNTIEAILYMKSKGVGAYLGGTCNETDRSAQVCAHVAIATQPDQILAKPGMGVDEGLMVVFNEMQRTLTLLQHTVGNG